MARPIKPRHLQALLGGAAEHETPPIRGRNPWTEYVSYVDRLEADQPGRPGSAEPSTRDMLVGALAAWLVIGAMAGAIGWAFGAW